MHALAAPFIRGYLDAFTLSAPEVPAWTALLARGTTPAQRAAWQPIIAAYRDPLRPHTALPPIPVALLQGITAGMDTADRIAITTTVGVRWWWGAAVIDPLPNYSIHQLLVPMLLRRIATYFQQRLPSAHLHTIHDDVFQQVLRFVQAFLRVPIHYQREMTSTQTWSAELVVEDCPFCTLSDGCGVWYGLWSGLADWMANRPHLKPGADKIVHVPRPTDNWHHVRFINLSVF